jgi:hypothetical protein
VWNYLESRNSQLGQILQANLPDVTRKQGKMPTPKEVRQTTTPALQIGDHRHPAALAVAGDTTSATSAT